MNNKLIVGGVAFVAIICAFIFLGGGHPVETVIDEMNASTELLNDFERGDDPTKVMKKLSNNAEDVLDAVIALEEMEEPSSEERKELKEAHLQNLTDGAVDLVTAAMAFYSKLSEDDLKKLEKFEDENKELSDKIEKKSKKFQESIRPQKASGFETKEECAELKPAGVWEKNKCTDGTPEIVWWIEDFVLSASEKAFEAMMK